MIARKKWKRKKQGEFLSHIGDWLTKGYHLEETISIYQLQQKAGDQASMERLFQMLSKGGRLDESLHTLGFSPDVCALVYFSMQSENLGHSLKTGGHWIIAQEKQKEKIWRVLRYPLFLLWMLAAMFFMAAQYVIPNFEKLFHSFSMMQMPFITRMVLYLADHFYLIILICLIFIFSIGTLLYMFQKKVPALLRYRILQYLPFARIVVRLYLSYIFCFQLGSVLNVGLSMNEALTHLAKQNHLLFFKEEAERLKLGFKKGETFAGLIRARGVYVNELPFVIINGETGGKLGKTMLDYSLLLQKRLEKKLRTGIAVVQPAVFFIVAGLAVSFYLAIMMPVFKIINGL